MSHATLRHSTRMLAVLFTCAAIAPARAQTDEQLLRALDSAWNATFVAKDSIKLATYYAPQAIGIYPNAPPVRGAAAIGSAYAGMLRTPGMKLTPTRTSSMIAKSGDLATNSGRYRLSFNGPDGPIVDSGSYVEVLQKINGQWKIVNEIVVSESPLPTPPVFDTVTTMAMTGSAKISWSPLERPGFAPGAKIAVIHGDPAGPGDYTVRLSFPDGYQVPVHWHPKAEHLTVISGTLMAGMGKQSAVSALNAYQPGDFLYIPARAPHFAAAKGATVVQLHGMGPFVLNLGAP